VLAVFTGADLKKRRVPTILPAHKYTPKAGTKIVEHGYPTLAHEVARYAGDGVAFVVAETDAEAERLARPAYDYWYGSLVKLWLIHDATPITGMLIADYDEACEKGVCVVGSAATVLDKISAQLDQLAAVNYLVCQLAWGSLTHDQEMHSLEMFTSEIMPALAAR